MADDDWAAAIEEQEKCLSKQVDSLTIITTPKDGGDVKAVQPDLTQNTDKNVSGSGDAPSDAATAADASLLNKMIRSHLVASKQELEILQKDPNSPLYSVKSFEALHLKPELLKGVYAMGFNQPSKIQETALPTLLADPPQNMIAQSQSGTGKTAAFVLTMLSRVDASLKHPQALCLSPTYELALQTGEVCTKMAQYMPDVGMRYAVRGERLPRGAKITEQIIIGTPGTLLDWCMKFKFLDLKKVKVFVLDEADVMIATQGHQDQSIRIHKGLSSDCQMLLFSATYETQVMRFAEGIIKTPITIRLRREEESIDNIMQVYIEVTSKESKYEALSNIYGLLSIGQSMIFCHTRKTASWLSGMMSNEGHAVALLSGELTVEQRAAVIKRFREGKEKVLITTNVSSRGIDVEQVTVVVNFDLPVDQSGQADCETYLHRIGRTGRFGKKGIAFNMVDGPRAMKVLEAIEKHFGKPIQKIDPDDPDEIEKMGRHS